MEIFSSPSPKPESLLSQLRLPVTTAPEFEMKLIQSSSPFNINFDRKGEFAPNTSNVFAMAIASLKEWTIDDAAEDALSFERSEENAGVAAPKDRERARRSREGGEEAGDEDEATTAAMMDDARDKTRIRTQCVKHKSSICLLRRENFLQGRRGRKKWRQQVARNPCYCPLSLSLSLSLERERERETMMKFMLRSTYTLSRETMIKFILRSTYTLEIFYHGRSKQ